MRVSVVLCTHTLERYDDFLEAVGSVREQTYDDIELVVVSDGSPEVADRYRADFGDDEDIVIVELTQNRGLLRARNEGAEAANGDVVTFLDDDAVAEAEWIAGLVDAYRTHDVLAAGGKMIPKWVTGQPGFLPDEFYWLIGVTHRGFGPGGDRDTAGEVRNTNGSNLSFRRDVFRELGGFDTDIGGRRGDANLQGGETELCARLRSEFDSGVWYNPEAVVAHKVFDYRTDPWWLLDRAFWQGYSKRAMETLVDGSTTEETAFLRALATRFFPQRLQGLATDPSRGKIAQLVSLIVFTGVVGAGYLYGAIKY
jgi:glycosyltransferase involved in cell wall biosynthesis